MTGRNYSEAAAKAMGWVVVDTDYYDGRLWCPNGEGRGVFDGVNGSDGGAFDFPSCDQMLAWLGDNGWQTHAVAGVMTRGAHVYLTRFAGVEMVEIGQHPTLHAALVGAVQAVDARAL